MEKKLKELLIKLDDSVTNDNFIDISYGVIEEIEEREDALESIQPILMLIEKNPNVDFGRPGPLVHFVERFYKNGYEEKLIESLKRFPTKHTVWMLNRIINASQGEYKKYFVNQLEDIIMFPNVDKEVVLLAKHFRDLQS